MGEAAVKEAFQRIRYAMSCDEQSLYQEAYRNYLATSSYVSNVLGLRSSDEVWCDEDTLKLLGIAQMCIEAATKINKIIISRKPDKNLSTATEKSTPPVSTQTVPPVTSDADIASVDDMMDKEDPDDLLSLLDSLPEVPANKPGEKYKAPMKRSATLPILPKTEPKSTPSTADHDPSKVARNHPPKNVLSTRSRSVYIPPSKNDPNYFSSPLGTNLGGTLNNPVILRGGPMERAKQQNAVLAAKYQRRAERGMLRPRDRLELIRAQEENIMIARELEKTLNKKAEQRRQRLEQEEAEQSTEKRTIGTFEAVLYGNRENILQLVQDTKNYDIEFRTWSTEADGEGADKMNKIITWCFGEKSHPISKVITEAQYNFFHRLAPLSQKMFLASPEERGKLMDGINAELEAVTGDITEYLRHLMEVFLHIYPIFECETGEVMLHKQLNSNFFSPFLEQLLEIYSYVMSEELLKLKEYLSEHADDDITKFSDIKKKYHLGEDPYRGAITTLQEITQTSSPVHKSFLLNKCAQLIASSISEHYLSTGCTEEEARDYMGIGADDLNPLLAYVFTRANKPELLVELQFLRDITPESAMLGQEGYCITMASVVIASIVEQGRSVPLTQNRESDL